MATLNQKNSKHNIYKTKAQMLRDEVTKKGLEKNQYMELEDAYYGSLARPKLKGEKVPLRDMLNTVTGPQRAQSSQHGSPGANSDFIKIRSSQNQLPPLKAKKDSEQENEIKHLIKKNLLMDAKSKLNQHELRPQTLKRDASHASKTIESVISQSDSRKEKNDMLSQYFNMKKSLKP